MNREPTSLAGGDRHRPGVIDQLAELFLQHVDSGEWALGAQIPTEVELVRRTGAGRNSVREAVQSLVQAGLLQREQGRGTFVVARSQLAQSLQRRVSRSERRQALELRSAIDGATAALAAQRRTADDVDVLRRALAERGRVWEEGGAEERIAADTALHRAVAVATHNELFVDLYDGLLTLFESVLRADVGGEIDHHARSHERLVAAIVEGDPSAARGQVAALLDPLIDGAGA